MNPTTQYHLEEYLKRRKELDAGKPAREPSGFMKKQSESAPDEEQPRKRRASLSR